MCRRKDRERYWELSEWNQNEDEDDEKYVVGGAKKICSKLGDVSFQISNFLMHGLIFQPWP